MIWTSTAAWVFSSLTSVHVTSTAWSGNVRCCLFNVMNIFLKSICYLCWVLLAIAAICLWLSIMRRGVSMSRSCWLRWSFGLHGLLHTTMSWLAVVMFGASVDRLIWPSISIAGCTMSTSMIVMASLNAVIPLFTAAICSWMRWSDSFYLWCS